MRPIYRLVTVILAALVATGCGQFGQRYTGSEEENRATSDQERRITDQPFDEEARKADGCTKVQEFDSEGNTHVEETVDYDNNPPHSGKHSPVALAWGIYDEPQKDEQTVHNLEHGHLVVSYKGLSDEERSQLLDHVRMNSYHLVVHPRPKNPKDGVYYTAWTAQVHCKKPSAPALQHMIDEWRDQGPELLTDDPSRKDEA